MLLYSISVLSLLSTLSFFMAPVPPFPSLRFYPFISISHLVYTSEFEWYPLQLRAVKSEELIVPLHTHTQCRGGDRMIKGKEGRQSMMKINPHSSG
jgi:hypothetical protein